jgi:hypothetical protein
MNSRPADTRSPHLDLADLIAGVTGQPVTDQAADHLARCEQCRAEARRWDLVAGGVRGLAAAAPQTAPAGPPRRRPRVLAGPRRRTILTASAAAAVVVLAGAGYAVTGALTRPAPGAVLTAVTGCNGLQLGAGTLEQRHGSSLVLKMAAGKAVTVTTAPSTRVSVAGPLRQDITDGATVVVLGPRSGGAIAAASVTITPSLRGVSVTPPPGWVVATGTVSDAEAAGFTVVTPGARIPVTTSGSTFVNVSQARLGQLKTGMLTVVVGRPAADGTLAAAGLLQQSARSGLQVQFHVQVRGCPPASLAAALDRVLAPGS